jgi:putative peptide zinc metalloprotease protein
MNLAEALNAALPELPAKWARAGFPKVDPHIIWARNIEDGQPVIVAHKRRSDSLFRFSPEQWQLIELFDGLRSWAEIADEYQQKYNVRYSPDDVHEFADELGKIGFWYKSPQESNIALNQKLAEHRHQRQHRKSKIGDVAHIQFSAWDPDHFLDRIYPHLRWVYTRGFTLLTILLFAFMIYVFASRWSEIGHDTLTYYTFTNKGARDLAEFWILFLLLGFFHESAHGLTCKHYGGQVHRMGFHLIYLSPAFFVDVTEAWVYASRWQRFITIIAGIWIELIFCAICTILWWGLPAGSYAHEISYKIMLITGVAVVVVNMNPLIKLDGYYAFSEIIGFSDIKEKSTTFLSTWIRKHIFRLPVEVEYVPKRRRKLYLAYAVLSGIYSYGLLFVVVRFSQNVFLNYSREWAFVPALALAYFIFRSRIRIFIRFMNTVYLDKKERIRAWLGPSRVSVAAVVLLVVALVPWWPRTVEGRFVVEAQHRETIRAAVPGEVLFVYVGEGDKVVPGQLLLKMRNLALESKLGAAEKNLALSQDQQIAAQLSYADLGQATEQRRQDAAERITAAEEAGKVTARAGISGVVVSPAIKDLPGTYLEAGSTVAEIVDISTMRARMFVPEAKVSEVRPGSRVRLLLDAQYSPIATEMSGVLPTSSSLAPGLAPSRSYKGLAGENYYVAECYLLNDGSLRDQMSGTFKIFVDRQSIAGMLGREIRDFVGRKVW